MHMRFHFEGKTEKLTDALLKLLVRAEISSLAAENSGQETGERDDLLGYSGGAGRRKAAPF